MNQVQEEQETQEPSSILSLYMEITQLSREQAEQDLATTGYNLSVCLERVFNPVSIDRMLETTRGDRNRGYDIIQETRHTDLACDATKQKDKNGNNLIQRQRVIGENHTESRTNPSTIPFHSMSDSHDSTNQSEWISNEWHQTIHACRQKGTLFTDLSFPPEISSLDGRLRNRNANHHDQNFVRKTGETKEIVLENATVTIVCDDDDDITTVDHLEILCLCGIRAASKTVQSDGPNYGRSYLCCGKASFGWKRKRTNQDQVENDKNTMESSIHKTITNSHQHHVKNTNKCKFFLWDDDGMRGGHAPWAQKISWFRFDKINTFVPSFNNTTCQTCIVRENVGFHSKHVQQGSMLGNCWFLSALAVVAEKPYLIRRLIPTREMNDVGCYQVNFYLDGRWQSVLIDSNLPGVVFADSHSNASLQSKKKTWRKNGIRISNSLRIFPAFAAWTEGNMWAALIEKAYSKIHGSYASLSGGYISEAFYDLTGAPTERIYLSSCHNRTATAINSSNRMDLLWTRLLSFSTAGFVMGAATSKGGDGIIPYHAYSILKVIELHDALQGEQQKLTDFFAGNQKAVDCVVIDDDDEVIILEKNQSSVLSLSNSSIENTNSQVDTFNTLRKLPSTIRLIQIRNPWGHHEFKGSWSAKSDQWTRSLRKLVGASFKQGDGIFFMCLDDFLHCFDHVDVSKCHEDWFDFSHDFDFLPTNNFLSSCDHFILKAAAKTWAFLSIVQPKKRANTNTTYWYHDMSIIILKRANSSCNEWSTEICRLQGMSRICEIEIFFEPSYEYLIVPLSFGCRASLRTQENLIRRPRLSAYSATRLEIEKVLDRTRIEFTLLTTLHKEILKASLKEKHVLGPQCLFIVSQSFKCAYFLAINASSTYCLQLRLVLQMKGNDVHLVHGAVDDVYVIHPREEKICVVVLCDGRESQSSMSSVHYSIYSDGMTRISSSTESSDRCMRTCPNNIHQNICLGSSIDITLSGDLLAGSGDFHSVFQNHKGELLFSDVLYDGLR